MFRKNYFIMAALLCLLALGMTSCDDPAEHDGTEQPGDEPVQADTETAETKITPELPDVTFDGVSFNLLQWYRGEGHIHNFFEYYSDGINGEQLNDAIYERNIRIQEEYDVVITQNGVEDPAETIEREVLAGSCNYNMVAARPSTLANVSRNGVFLNFNEVPYIDTSKPWWNSNANEAFTVNGATYLMSGDLVLYEKQRLPIFFFNRDMATDYQLGDLYELVNEGKWTVDVMNSYVSVVSNDTDGDGNLSWKMDNIGLLEGSYTYIPFLLFGMDNTYSTKLEDGSFELNLSSERMIASIDKLGKSLYTDNTAWGEVVTDNWKTASPQYVFEEGRSLFYHEVIFVLRSLEMSAAYGVLPQPKYDEAQELYLTTVQYDNSGAISVPATLTGTELEMTGIILEAMAADSSESIMPVFIEKTLQSKKAPDAQSSDMLEIVFKNISYDLFGAFNIGNVPGLIAYNVYFDHGEGYASTISSQYETIMYEYEELLEDYSQIAH